LLLSIYDGKTGKCVFYKILYYFVNTVTICIPTYNREKELKIALESIRDILGNQVSVVVSDNASTDDTETLCQNPGLIGKFNAFTYFRWPTNQGADRNYLKAVELATTEYCILFGSDDTPTASALNLINEAIQAGADVAVFGRKLYTRDMEREIRSEAFWTVRSRRVLRLDSEADYANYFRTCTSLAGVFSYISAILFRKLAWQVDEQVRSYIGTAYVHVAALFQGMRARGSVQFIVDPRPIVCCRLGNDSFLDGGAFRRFEIDWNAYERLARDYFPQMAGKSLTGILRYQCSAYGLASLRYHILVAGRREQLGQVTFRLRASDWGGGPLVRWRLLNLVPLFILQQVFMVRRIIRRGGQN
jgi:abequosyltransferase